MSWGKGGYDRLKALGMCVECGKRPVIPGQVHCEQCREKRRKYAKEHRNNVKDYRPVKRKIEYTERSEKPKPQYTLDDLAVMARKEGISYGQLVARLEGHNGKTE